MPLVLNEWAISQEVSNRVDRLRAHFANNPFIKRIDHRIGHDWSEDLAVFIEVFLSEKEIARPELFKLAEDIRAYLLFHVRTEEFGLHSYLNFVDYTGA